MGSLREVIGCHPNPQGWCPYKKRQTPELSVSGENTERKHLAVYKPGRKFSPETNPANLDLGLLSSRTVRNCCCLRNHLWYSVLPAQANILPKAGQEKHWESSPSTQTPLFTLKPLRSMPVESLSLVRE